MTIPSPPEPDGSFLARVAAFEPEAFSQFYLTYLRPVQNKLALQGLARHEVEEIADAVLEEAARKLSSFHPAKRFITWLLTITKHRAIDYQRRRGWTKVDGRYVSPEQSLEEVERRSTSSRKGEKQDADEVAFLRFIDERAASLAEVGEMVRRPEVTRALLDLEVWVNARSDADRTAAEHYMFGTPWKEIAARLSSDEKLVSEDAAKMRGSRLIKKAMHDLAHLGELFGTPAAQQPVKSARGRTPTTNMDGAR